MRERTSGSYTVKKWDEAAVVEFDGGRKLTRASVAGAYDGDIAGDATTESAMCYGPDGSATYVGMERIVGTLAGRSGSFVLEGRGAYDGGEARTKVRVVAGSGTGELEGLAGEGSFAATHEPPGKLELDYWFE